MKRGGNLKRSPMKRKGKRAEREQEALEHFRDRVLWRAQGVCERCDRVTDNLDAHHKRTNPRVHDPELGAALCRPCHRGVHDHSAEDWREWFT